MSYCTISIHLDVPLSLFPPFLSPCLLLLPLTHGCLIANILKENAESLQQLQAYKTSTILREGFQEIRLHVLLKKEAGRGGGECGEEVSAGEEVSVGRRGVQGRR